MVLRQGRSRSGKEKNNSMSGLDHLGEYLQNEWGSSKDLSLGGGRFDAAILSMEGARCRGELGK